MTFKLIKEIPFPKQDYFRVSNERHIDHLTLLYDYLTETFWPSIGYTIADVLSLPAVSGTGTILYAKSVSFPVTDAAGYSDHIMHTWCGFSRTSNDFLMVQGTNQYLDSSYPDSLIIGQNYLRYTGNSYQYVETSQYLPIRIYQDQARKSDWFVLQAGRLAMWYIKPRVFIQDLYRDDLRDPNIRYSTALGFQYRDYTETCFGVHGCSNLTNSRKRLAYAVPLDGFQTLNSVLYRDVIMTGSTASSAGPQQHTVASFHNPNYAIWKNFDDTYTNQNPGLNPALTDDRAFSDMEGFTGVTSKSQYYRLQDNEGNWWLLGWMRNFRTSSWVPAFNCGPELP
jgi:hypothetical protein